MMKPYERKEIKKLIDESQPFKEDPELATSKSLQAIAMMMYNDRINKRD